MLDGQSKDGGVSATAQSVRNGGHPSNRNPADDSDLATPAQSATRTPRVPARAWHRPAQWIGDLGRVALVTLIAARLSVHYEASEHLLAWMRRREALQADELPGVLLVLACALLWFAWRRYRELDAALALHRAAERRLARELERNRRLHGALLEVQEQERRSIARELHDELGQYLGVLRYDLHALARFDGADPAAEHAQLVAQAQHNLAHVHATARELIGRLRPAGLDELGLVAALDQLVSGWRQRLPETRFTLDCRSIDGTLDDPSSIAIFRIVQEALTNVARHARAGQVEVQVQGTAGSALRAPGVEIAVIDDGVGFDPLRPREGLGLRSIAERAGALGGSASWQTAPGDGFALQVRLPWPTREDEHA